MAAVDASLLVSMAVRLEEAYRLAMALETSGDDELGAVQDSLLVAIDEARALLVLAVQRQADG